MKKLLLAILAVGAFSVSAMAQAQGTDGFGYTWKSSSSPTGPVYNWIDISTTGTRITGLADDNFIGPIPIGFNFQYYLLNYNQLFIGSNGFINFGRGFNLSSGQIGATGNGFRNMPYGADNLNNVVAPFLADLSFVTNTGAPVANARAYYQTIGTRFIVSYENVPYYNSAGPGQVVGNNSFQVILDNADTSITYQYRSSSQGADANYTNALVTGFEDINGQYGGTVVSGGSAANLNLPPDSSAVTIKYPARVLIQIKDVRVSGALNSENAGDFVYKGNSTPLLGLVQNTGSNDITGSVRLRVVVQDVNGTVVLQDTGHVAGLARSATGTVTFSRPFPSTAAVGTYTVTVTSQLPGDQIPGNNTAEAELVVVDTASFTDSLYTLGYNRNIYTGTSQDFESQNGGIYIAPPAYPAKLRGIQFDMGWVTADDYTDSALIGTFRVLRDDGPNGSPGTVINEWTVGYDYRFIGDSIGELVLQGSVAGKIMRSELMLPATYNVTSGGLYIGVFQDRTTRFFWNAVMKDLEPPFSNRAYEAPGGAWALNRNNGTFDYGLRGLFKGTLLVGNKPSIAAAGMTLYPNPSTTWVKLTGVNGRNATVFNASGQMVKVVKVTDKAAIISLNGMNKGVYTVRAESGQVSRFVKE